MKEIRVANFDITKKLSFTENAKDIREEAGGKGKVALFATRNDASFRVAETRKQCGALRFLTFLTATGRLFFQSFLKLKNRQDKFFRSFLWQRLEMFHR